MATQLLKNNTQAPLLKRIEDNTGRIIAILQNIPLHENDNMQLVSHNFCEEELSTLRKSTSPKHGLSLRKEKTKGLENSLERLERRTDDLTHGMCGLLKDKFWQIMQEQNKNFELLAIQSGLAMKYVKGHVRIDSLEDLELYLPEEDMRNYASIVLAKFTFDRVLEKEGVKYRPVESAENTTVSIEFITLVADSISHIYDFDRYFKANANLMIHSCFRGLDCIPRSQGI